MTQSQANSGDDAQAIDYSVVLPLHDERDSVASLIDEICTVMATCAFEIVAVDDGSEDGTGEVLVALARSNARLRLVFHDGNRGQSAAICSGADSARGRYLVTLDGDGQNDPADIPRLIAAYPAGDGPALVCGKRLTRADAWSRRLASRVANAVRARVLGDRTVDSGCGLKLIERRAFARLPRFDHMHRFLPALVLREGGTVCSVAVNHRPRLHGRSHYGVCRRLLAGIVDLAGVLWLKYRRLPAADAVPQAGQLSARRGSSRRITWP